MKINDQLLYVDEKGALHNALVQAMNGMNEGVVDLIYVQPNGEVRKVFSVVHASDESKQENNAELPSYALNSYLFPGEEHKPVPEDHPIHDHPFEAKQYDSDGNLILKSRPKFEEHVKEHKESLAEKIKDGLHGAGDALGNAIGESFVNR